MSGVNLAPALDHTHRTEKEAFPSVDHGRIPLLTNYIVQIRTAMKVSSGGIHIVEQAQEADTQNCTVGKVVAISPMCFHDSKGNPWPEGPSFEVGDYLQIPRFGGFRYSVKINEDDEVVFVVFDHLQQIAKIPDVRLALAMTSYL